MNVLRWLRLWGRHHGDDETLREELEFHRAEIQRALEEGGMNPKDAVLDSRRRMGNMTLAREDARQVWIWRWLDHFWQDARYASRAFRRSPSFSIAAFVTLALGIGVNAAIYSIVDAAILRPLPYTRPDRLVSVRLDNRLTGFQTTGMMPRDFLDWRERNSVFRSIAATGGAPLTLEGGDPERLLAARVTSEFFDVFDVKPLFGRTFTVQDEEPANGQVVILSNEFWRQRFGGAPGAIGRTLTCLEGSYQIVGVLPANFSYPAGRRPTAMFVPMTFDSQDRQYGVAQSLGAAVVGRLRDDVAVAQAQSAMTQLQSALDQHHVGFNRGYSVVELIPLLNVYVSSARSWMLLLLGAVACVLLIACANVANLFIAHAAARVHELTIRGALGAGRRRIAAQLMIETLVIAGAGGVAGILLGWLTLNLLRTSLPSSIPRAISIGLDARVLGVMSLAVIATGLICGILPAFQASRLDLVEGLKQAGGHSATAARAPQRTRYTLAWSEVTLATLLLVGAGLLIVSFARLLNVPKGFDPTGVMSFEISFPQMRGQSVDAASAHARAEFAAILAAVRTRPGLEAALDVTGSAPFEGGYTQVPFVRAGDTPPTGKGFKLLGLQRVSDGFLEMLRVPIRSGRSLAPSDTATSNPVVVVNEAAVKELWDGRSPLGDRIRINKALYEVVGVAGDIRYRGPATPPVPEAFVPYLQSYVAGGPLLVRARAREDVIPLVKAAVWSVDPTLPITDIRTADELFDLATAERRFNMELISVFALLALAIAATGVYGVLAFAMNQRRREIGIRLALGAQPASVVAALVRSAGFVIAAGIASGLGAAWALSRTVQSFLFEVNPRDPLLLAGVATTIAIVATAAAWLPARRAASVDPLTVLRTE